MSDDNNNEIAIRAFLLGNFICCLMSINVYNNTACGIIGEVGLIFQYMTQRRDY